MSISLPAGLLLCRLTAAFNSADAQRSTQDGLPYSGYRNQTVRQLVHLSAGTPFGLRVRLTNALSDAPITLADIHVAHWAGSATKPTASASSCG